MKTTKCDPARHPESGQAVADFMLPALEAHASACVDYAPELARAGGMTEVSDRTRLSA